MNQIEKKLSAPRYVGIIAKAIRKADVKTLQFYIEDFGLSAPLDTEGKTMLMFAAMAKNFRALQYLIDLGTQADFDAVDYLGQTALMHAARTGKGSAVYLLLATGADVNLKDNDGETALMIASRTGNEDIVNLLVGSGAIVNARSKFDGTTALMAAAAAGHKSIMEILIGRGAYKKARDFFGLIAEDWLTAPRHARLLCGA